MLHFNKIAGNNEHIMRGLRIKNVSKIYKFMGSHRKGESL